MNKPDIPERFGEKLLQQDESFQSDRYREHRMRLEKQLVQAESRKKLTKRILIGAALLAAGFFPIAASGHFGSPDPYSKDATIFSVTAGTIYFISCSVLFIGMASYYSRFSPRVTMAREELRDESIRELQKELARLRQILEGKNHKEKDTKGTSG